MKHILMFEISLEGHHSVYLEHIASAYLEMGYLVTITILQECENHPIVKKLKDRFLQNVNFNIIHNVEINSILRSLGGNMGGELANWLIFKSKYLEIHSERQVDYVFFPYLDYCLYIIGLLGPPFDSSEWSGICMQATIHHSKYKFLKSTVRFNVVKKIVFFRMLKCTSLNKLFTIDELLFRFINDEYAALNNHVEYLADPVELKGNHTRVSARKMLDIPEDAVIVLVYGQISARKGIDVLVKALFNPEVARSVHVLIVGKHDELMGGFFESNEVKELYRDRRIHILNGFVDVALEQMAFVAADIVWLGYKNHFSMSGVLVLAAMARKVIIATRDGLIGWHTRDKRLGITVNVEDVSTVKAALIHLSNPLILRCYQMSIKPYFDGHTWGKAIDSILKATPAL